MTLLGSDTVLSERLGRVFEVNILLMLERRWRGGIGREHVFTWNMSPQLPCWWAATHPFDMDMLAYPVTYITVVAARQPQLEQDGRYSEFR